MSDESKQEKAVVEYVPFGGDSKVKLSIQIVKQLICVPTKSGKICSEADAIKFMAMCQARKLNPWEGDAFLIGYDGQHGPTYSLITAHQAFLKRAEVNTEYDGMESGVVVEKDGKIEDIQGDFTTGGQKVLGGWARVFFKNRSHPMYKRIRLSRFQKSFGVWQDDPAGMICKCAEADALRSSFPTMLGGLYIREEKDAHGIEIVDAKVEPVSNGRNAATPLPKEPSPFESDPTPKQTAAPTPAASPVRKRQSRLKPKPEPEVTEPPAAAEPTRATENRYLLNQRLAVGGYNELQFLEVCNKNEWLGKGRKWDNLNDVPDDMLAVFLTDDEWTVVQTQLEKVPSNVKD